MTTLTCILIFIIGIQALFIAFTVVESRAIIRSLRDQIDTMYQELWNDERD